MFYWLYVSRMAATTSLVRSLATTFLCFTVATFYLAAKRSYVHFLFTFCTRSHATVCRLFLVRSVFLLPSSPNTLPLVTQHTSPRHPTHFPSLSQHTSPSHPTHFPSSPNTLPLVTQHTSPRSRNTLPLSLATIVIIINIY